MVNSLNVGILGGGQLGRMLALAGHALGIRCRVLEREPDCPAGAVCEVIAADYTDAEALRRLANLSDVVTYEFENVPVEAVRILEGVHPVYPPSAALSTFQDRLSEKQIFTRLDIETNMHQAVASRADLDAAVSRVGLPAVLKRRRMGYDGKGQAVIRTESDVDAAWQAIGDAPLLLEAFVPFDWEGAIIAVRSTRGETRFYPLVETRHSNGILSMALAPAPRATAAMEAAARQAAQKLMDALNYSGVMALELFVAGDRLIANEMAPRVHNSGHWTIEGAETSQFENHLRAILGLPLGLTEAVGHSAMVNLVSDVPPLARLMSIEGASVHLYGKSPRPGRKLGHVTLHAADADERDRRSGKALTLVAPG